MDNCILLHNEPLSIPFIVFLSTGISIIDMLLKQLFVFYYKEVIMIKNTHFKTYLSGTASDGRLFLIPHRAFM